MRRHSTWLDRGTVERLLDGATSPPGFNGTTGDQQLGGPDVLARLLRAAAGHAHGGEVVGEQDAMDAFRAARLGIIGPPRRPSSFRMALAKLLTLKAAILAAVAVAATGGVALAATSGALPLPLRHGPPEPRTTPAHSTAVPSPTPAATAPGSPGPLPPPTATALGSPVPAVLNLCRAYTAGAGNNPGKALDNPAFGALVDAAGGRDKVAAYCAAALATANGGGNGGASGGNGDGPPAVGRDHDGRPGGAPGHPTGKPDKQPPKGPPTAEPNGNPHGTDHPPSGR